MTPGEKAKLRRTWPQRLLLTFNVGMIVVALLAAGALAFTYRQVTKLPRVELGGALTPEPEGSVEPQNYLIVGTDSGEGLDPDDPVLNDRPSGLRSDVVMVLRVIPDKEQALVLSLPRDLWIPIAGTGGNQRINTAIQGGPERLVDTVENVFDIPINHYLEVNFLGFRDIVSAIDGIPMYFPTPVRDRKTGLNVEDAGCVTLDPVQALAFARSRAYEYFEDGHWHTDPTGDLGRISRQQDFLRSGLHRAFARGARNPLVLRELLDAGLKAVKVDTSLKISDLASLAEKFRSFDPSALQTYSVPVTGDQVGGASVVRLDDRDAQPILDLFRPHDESTSALGSVLASVQNGSGLSNDGSRVANALRDAGFNIPLNRVSDAATFDHARTEVRYAPALAGAAELLASYLSPEPVLVADPGAGDEVVVVTGTDDVVVLDTPRAGAPSTTTTLPPTTTSLIGVVPGPPPEGVDC